MEFLEFFSLQALPYLLMGMILFWNGFLFSFFHARFPQGRLDSKGYLFFGLASLFLSGYAWGCMALYLTGPTEAGFVAVSVRGICLVTFVVFLFLFSASYLKLKNPFWWLSPIIIGTILIILCLFPGGMLHKSFSIYETLLWGIPIKQTTYEAAIGGRIFVAWALSYALVLLYFWIKFYRQTHQDLSIVLAYSTFILFGFYQSGIQLQLYSGLTLLAFGFFGMLAVISLRLFRHVIQLNRAYNIKSQALQKANQEIRFLLRIISHDVIGPLVSIHGFADILENDSVGLSTKKKMHYLKRIETNVAHMNRLLDGITEYLLMLDQPNSKFFPMNCEQTLKEVLREFLSDAEEWGEAVRPTIEVVGVWPPCLIFPKDCLKYILKNLIENAAVHGRNSFKKQESSRIILEGSLKEGSFQISVKDRGPGISPELHEKVFDINFLKDRGALVTGLGLPTIKKIVENFSGKVWVDTDYSHGACIRISLPYHSSPSHWSSKIKQTNLSAEHVA